MNKILLEEIIKIKRLSKYDTKLTLTENQSELEETVGGVNIGTIATELKAGTSRGLKGLEDLVKSLGEVEAKALVDEFKLAGKDEGIINGLLTKSPADYKLSYQDALKADIESGKLIDFFGPETKLLSRIDCIRKMIEKSKLKGKVIGPAKGGQQRYVELTSDEIREIIRSEKEANRLYNKNVIENPSNSANPSNSSNSANLSNSQQQQNLINNNPQIRNMSWKDIKKWALASGLTILTAIGLYKLTHNGEEPVEDVRGAGASVDNTTATNDQGTSPQTTVRRKKYKPCSNPPYTPYDSKLPNKQGCFSEDIRRAQACLGMPSKYQTGNFGPITQGYLKDKFRNNTNFIESLTLEDIDVVCGKNTETTGSDNKPDNITFDNQYDKNLNYKPKGLDTMSNQQRDYYRNK
jgi:hypothetical protein